MIGSLSYQAKTMPLTLSFVFNRRAGSLTSNNQTFFIQPEKPDFQAISMSNVKSVIANLRPRRVAWLMAGLVLVSQGLAKTALTAEPPDLVIENFEGTNFGGWKATGDAFGNGPAHGALPNQMALDGFLGRGFASSFHRGDGSTGKLTSPSFKVERKYIQFLIGGGGFDGKTCLNLLSEGKVVRNATGPNTRSGGSEHLEWQSWDVGDLAGKNVVLEIVDLATEGWGHLSIDQITQTDRKITGLVLNDVALPIKTEKRYLNLPVKNGAAKRTLRLQVDGKTEREFEIELADGEPDWWAFLDLTPFKGKPVVLRVNKLPENSRAMKMIEQTDEVKDARNIYHEALRPQFHFSPRRGWNNDPNGMVFYRGEYHLFFQHNPYGWDWGNMHWGHAVSRDLVHWTERPEALYPDQTGMMYSGSAVVDWKNTSGFGRNGQPPLVMIYTAAGDQFTQCLAYSPDGGQTFAKYDGNPVVKQITGGNRDPKIFWHEPTGRWIMALWVEQERKNTIRFLTSPNLKDWTMASEVNDFFECPDFFELPMDGNPANKKWVLTAANSEYEAGAFDGHKFTAETSKLPGQRGDGFYAAQTFSDLPADDGRRIQIGWLRAPSPGMPFNQCMSLPHELKLLSTPDGVRLTRQPVRELARLRDKAFEAGSFTLKPGDANPLVKAQGEQLELRAEFEPGQDGEVCFTVRGIPITYSAHKQELAVNGHRAPAPLRKGKQSLIIYLDRTALEVFASDGLTYVPLPVIPKPDASGVEISTTGAPTKFSQLTAYRLGSIWK
ncbi:MAG: sacC [Pedosphaera sp.]|nr:sacC [Pedosphaera sp.]